MVESLEFSLVRNFRAIITARISGSITETAFSIKPGKIERKMSSKSGKSPVEMRFRIWKAPSKQVDIYQILMAKLILFVEYKNLATI